MVRLMSNRAGKTTRPCDQAVLAAKNPPNNDIQGLILLLPILELIINHLFFAGKLYKIIYSL